MGFGSFLKSAVGMLPGGNYINAGLAIGGALLGGHEQDKANKANLQAQQQQQQMMQQMINGQMLPKQNPYAAQMSDLFRGQQIQQWNPYEAQGYTATQGQAPMLSGMPDALSYLTVNAPGGVSANQINPNFGAMQIATPNGINVQQVGGPRLGSDFNMGQDALMQMLNRSPGQQKDRAMEMQLRSMYGNGGQQDLSNLFAAQLPGQLNLLDQQVSQLRGGAGSLGQRFGSSLRGDEMKMRTDFLNNVNLNQQNALSQAYDAGQNRRLQALGLGGQNVQAANQNAIQGAGVQQGAAQQLLNSALQAAQMGQTADLQNAANSLQAQGIDINAALQAMQANQSAGLQANAQNLQAMLANQSTGLQAQQFNAGQSLQAMLANQQAGMQTGQFNNSQALQAALANQSMLGQFGLANMNAQNQAGQFNANMGLQGAQLNAQQQNIMNQMLMSGLTGANQMQMGNSQLNAQLLGLLGGVGVPQQQPGQLGNTIGDIGQFMTVMSMMNKKPAAAGAVAGDNLQQFAPLAMPNNYNTSLGYQFQ